MPLAAPGLICPHCGAENPKSLIVTMCTQCHGSLDGAKAAPSTLSAARPASSVISPPWPTVLEPTPEPAPPPRTRREPTPTHTPVPPPEPDFDAIATAPVQPPPVQPPPPQLPPKPEVPPRPETPPRPAPQVAPVRHPAQPSSLPRVTGSVRDFGAAPHPDAVLKEIPRAAKHGLGIVLLVGIAGAFVCGLFGEFLDDSFTALAVPLGMAAAGALIAIIARAVVTSTTYHVAVDARPGAVCLGETLLWGATVYARKAFDLGAAQIRIECREHAIRRAGNNTSHHRRTIYSQVYQLPGGQARAGQQVNLRAGIPLPLSGMATLAGRHNRVQWFVTLKCPVAGFAVDISEKTEVTVSPVVHSSEAGGAPSDPQAPAEWLKRATLHERAVAPEAMARAIDEPDPDATAFVTSGSVTTGLRVVDGLTLPVGPVIPAGETRELQLTLQAREGVNCRGVYCWIGCRIHGRGTGEEIVLYREQMIHEGPLPAGQPIQCPIAVTAPATGPLTFQGHYIKIDWMLRIRLDMPLWVDERIPVPFIVSPRLATEETP